MPSTKSYSFGDAAIDEWLAAGLIKPSAARLVVFTAEKRLILKRLGQLKENDQQAVMRVIEEIIG